MAIPSDMDSDPNAARIVYEVVVVVAPDTPIVKGSEQSVSARIAARTGITPTSVTIGSDGTVTVVIPDTGVDVGFWRAWVASALAAFGRTGIVTVTGNRARVTT